MRSAAWALFLAWLTLPAAAQEDSGDAGQRLRVEVHAVADADRTQFAPGEPLALHLSMLDLVDGQAIGGLHPAGFIRTRSSAGTTCAEAAQAYRATGRVALGDIDLAGVTLLVGQTDGLLAAVDPSTSLASANIRWLAHAQLSGAPLVHPESGKIVVGGENWQAVDASDGSVSAIDGLPAGAAVLGMSADGRALFVQAPDAGDLLVFDLDRNSPIRRLPVPGKVSQVQQGANLLAALADDGRRVLLIDTETGKTLAEHRLAAAASSLAYSPPADAFLLAGGPQLTIIHADAPDLLQQVALSGDAGRVALSADGKSAYAFAPESGLLSVVDLVRQTLAQALHFPEGIAAVAATHDNLVVLLARRWVAASVSTDTLKRGRSPNVTEVRLSEGGKLPGELPGPLMTAVGPVGPVLVAQPGMGEVYVMPHEAGMRAPTNAIPIRGGKIGSIAVYARRFTADGDGYRAVFSVPRPGRYEAVVSAGLFGATTCLPFAVGTPAAERAPPQLALKLPDLSAQGAVIAATVRFANAAAPPGTAVDLTVISANDNFQDSHSALLAADGSAQFSLQFPHPGMFIVSATARSGQRALSRTVEQIEIQ